ncbi:hypothetical protein AB870_17875 [Pandoraea faecigallinarum]|uniref:DUF4381 domain-containing protein n=1 Tax=Pandoraea faecigallinarum TaxID=656179 RepID=A0A0H3WTP1_9BURK|nr:DUF4381 domain-containing protein [Pandoraea faecigallinarum]AKM31584.1 hypothetical protein AB870_17875 [Pandoraea faecigallinarum]
MTAVAATAAPAADMPTLGALVDIVTPPAPSWTPQTIGWPVAAVLVAAGLLWFAWRTWRRYRANRYRREALAQLQQWAAALGEPTPNVSADIGAAKRARALREIAALLKRVALSAWPREVVASLTGNAWAAFLRASHDNRGSAADTLAALVSDAEYQSDERLCREWDCVRAAMLIRACRDWIERHHVPV